VGDANSLALFAAGEWQTYTVEPDGPTAGEKVVQVVGGPNVVQQLLNAQMVHELRIDVMPVLLGGGLRLLENVDQERVRLEKQQVHEIGARTSLAFRMVRG